MLEETRNMVHTFKAIEAAEREKLETRLVAHLDQQNIVRDQRQVSYRHFTTCSKHRSLLQGPYAVLRGLSNFLQTLPNSKLYK